ncbi:MAG: hypothetical protein EXS46_02890 [Candidatus Taylorbacteria bacterium]|nr:hypothetical protein [Candidatus Taylorbacteria bacterium]
MFNLLPQQEQRAALKEYRLRLATVALFFLCILGVVALVSLAPSLFLSYQNEFDLESVYEPLSKGVDMHLKDDPFDVAKNTDMKVATLSRGLSDSYAYELFAEIIKSRSSDIKIDGLYFSHQSENARTMIVTGLAKSRDSLRSFSEDLRGKKIFSEVSVPPSNFANAVDIKFSISVKIK